MLFNYGHKLEATCWSLKPWCEVLIGTLQVKCIMHIFWIFEIIKLSYQSSTVHHRWLQCICTRCDLLSGVPCSYVNLLLRGCYIKRLHDYPRIRWPNYQFINVTWSLLMQSFWEVNVPSILILCFVFFMHIICALVWLASSGFYCAEVCSCAGNMKYEINVHVLTCCSLTLLVQMSNWYGSVSFHIRRSRDTFGVLSRFWWILTSYSSEKIWRNW